MNGLLLALFATLLAGVGGRDQVTLAGLAERQGPRPGLLWTAVLVSCLTAALAAWLATLVIPLLTSKSRLTFAALALIIGGLESLLLSLGRRPEEPTHSLVALAIVLLAHQVADAARLLVLAIAVATQAPIPAAIGGALGGSALMTIAWSVPELGERRGLKIVRRSVGALLLVLAAVIGLGP